MRWLRWLVVPLVVLASASMSYRGSNPQQPRVASLSAQQGETDEAKTKMLERALAEAIAEMQAGAKAWARTECLKAKTVLLRDCKDLTATMECRNLAAQAHDSCKAAGMPIRVPRLDSVGCLGTGPFPAAPPATPSRSGHAGILDNYTCQSSAPLARISDHSRKRPEKPGS